MTLPTLITGLGCTPAGEHWDRSLCDLAYTAISEAVKDAGFPRIDAIVVGNMLSGVLNSQENLGAAIADRAGLRGISALKVEAACASASAALQVGNALISSGSAKNVVVIGVEKMTDSKGPRVITSLAFANDFETETMVGCTNTSLAALATQLYCGDAGVSPDVFASFAIHSYRQAVHNPYAMYRKELSLADYLRSPLVAPPLRLFDCPAICDGAAAVVLSSSSDSAFSASRTVELLAIEGATDTLALAQRIDPLLLGAVKESMEKALVKAGIRREQIDLIELHDAFPVVAALSLEANGFCPRRHGWRCLNSSCDAQHEGAPMQTLGGIRGRGHPVGASGLYQVIDLCRQLRGDAGIAQIADVQIGMAQCIGGFGGSAFTTILRRPTNA